MDNINDIISNLSNDDINMLKEVAASILGEKNSSADNHSNSNEHKETPPENMLSGLGSFDNIDFDMIMKAKSIFDKMNKTHSKNADLILALKPHLRQQSQDKADQAIKILKLFEVLPLLKELF